ncbi:FHA domain-containing protein [Agromyces marinus]|uniref:FHA domain-containing protein n=1 Tax=Agromyces marinus TaxID=1389020 RepID=A0ABN6YFB2_9MICO|nr:FHA domain-containing protein [Agromyces marinus]UIP58931.1 hypothetical protein DSM26151_18200 [Agromyces marinus]BDZ56104.1 hypothetical protein GCM10025870_31770 [Agromyces marinus]
MSEPDFIVPPPGLVPGAPVAKPQAPETAIEGTVRADRSLPSFQPPPGIRTPSSLPAAPSAPAQAASAQAQAQAQAQSQSQSQPRWRLRSADGVEMRIDDRVVAGRDPKPPAWMAGAVPFVVEDPSRSMSKTHALIEVSGGRLRATDLDSTNGVRVWPDGGDPLDLEPGVPTEVPHDAVLLLGDVAFLAERMPDDGA